MRNINEIIIHCSDTPEGRDNTVADITAWHKARGFRTIGYHYVIYRDGSIHTGRPEEEMGAHCKEGGHNRHSIGICYIGGKTADMKQVKDTRTPEQKEALLSLLRRLKARYPNAKIYGHRDFSSKSCPCFDAKNEYKNLVMALILAFSFPFLTGCRTTQRTLEEKVDSTMQQATSSSTTSLAVDKFIQSLVLNIDSIVFTSLSMPQVTQADDSTGPIGRTCDISGDKPCAETVRTSNTPPRIQQTQVVIKGLRLQSNTADSSSVVTVSTDSTSSHSSYHSNVKAKEVSKPPNRFCRWLSILSLIAIAMIVVIAMSRSKALRAFLRSILQKLIA